MENWTNDFFGEAWHKYGFPIREPLTESDLRLIEWLAGEPPVKILDLACGLGRLAIPLAGAGYDVVGCDFQPDYIAEAEYAAKKAGVTAEFLVIDMRELDYREDFDIVINFWGSFGYFPDDINREVITGVYNTLKPGGRFILQAPNRDAILADFRQTMWHEVNDVRVLTLNDFDIATSAIETEWTYVFPGGRIEQMTSYTRIYSFHELREMLLSAGFEKVEGWSGIETPLAFDANPMCVVGVKR
jgi:SAM-dependent methyltransferase